MTFNIVLAGARSVRQGTGPFIAAALQKAGACITGIVGTSPASVQQAEQELAQHHGIMTRGYTDLHTAIAAAKPDAVVLCTPWQVHAEQLAIVAAAGCHCLVEKPLAWPLSSEELGELIDAFAQRGLLLHMVSQWPYTLPAFYSLHGDLTAAVERFVMRLSPISIGQTMIPDAAPHLISMLQALVGPGDCENIVVTPGEDSNDQTGDTALESLTLDFAYRTVHGVTRTQLQLRTCEQRPRPAWYQINDLKVEREVVLPEYQQYLTANGRRVALIDPMELVVGDFMAALRDGGREQGSLLRLRKGHENLLQLAEACAQTLVVQAYRT